jgi:hypothetical protein
MKTIKIMLFGIGILLLGIIINIAMLRHDNTWLARVMIRLVPIAGMIVLLSGFFWEDQ